MVTDKLRQQPVFWLSLFIVLQLLVWSLAPYLLVKGVYVDILENIEWGRHWQWGYDKNPYVGAWLSYAIYYLSGRSFLALYLTSQLSVVIAWLAVWRLATRILPPVHALVSALGLAAISFYSGITVELNDNVINLSLWALTALFFYDATAKQSWRAWLLTGIFAGLAAMTKYYTLMLLLTMLLFLLVNPTARQSFKKPGLYIGLAVFLVITTPNLVWLINHSFITITYALGRAGIYKSLFYHILDHVLNPLLFLIGTGLFAVPVWILFKCCFKEKDHYQLSLFNKQYIYLLCFAPLVLSLLFSAITGARMIFMWSTTLFNFFIIFLIAYYRPVIAWENAKRFFIAVLSLFWVYFLLYVYVENLYPYTFKAATQQHIFEIFPGAEMANALTKTWQQRYHRPLRYVAGNRFYTLNLAAFSSNHPVAYFDCDAQKSPWINEQALRKEGAIFIWDKPEQQNSTCNLAQRFPQAIVQPIYHFAWALPAWPQKLLHLPEPPPVAVGVAFLPPA